MYVIPHVLQLKIYFHSYVCERFSNDHKIQHLSYKSKHHLRITVYMEPGFFPSFEGKYRVSYKLANKEMLVMETMEAF